MYKFSTRSRCIQLSLKTVRQSVAVDCRCRRLVTAGAEFHNIYFDQLYSPKGRHYDAAVTRRPTSKKPGKRETQSVVGVCHGSEKTRSAHHPGTSAWRYSPGNFPLLDTSPSLLHDAVHFPLLPPLSADLQYKAIYC